MSTAAPDPVGPLRALGLEGAAASRVRGGSDTAVWRVVAGSVAYALRLFPPGREGGCLLEAQVMNAAAAAGVPVPAVRARDVWRGHALLLTDWCPGQTVFEALLLRPADAPRLGRLFGAEQARVHRVPVPAGIIAEPWIDAAGPAADVLRASLEAVAPSRPALLHLDYHVLNVLTEGERITGVIDWSNARPGDPRADLARTFSILRLDLPAFAAASPLLPALPRFLLGWYHGYADAAGAAPQPPMAPFYAWAGAAMARDLAKSRDLAFLAQVSAWSARWASRAGCVLP